MLVAAITFLGGQNDSTKRGVGRRAQTIQADDWNADVRGFLHRALHAGEYQARNTTPGGGDLFRICFCPQRIPDYPWDNIKRAVDKGIGDQDPSMLENYVGDFFIGMDKESKTSSITSEVLEVTAAGTGFMLIARRVFEDFDAHYRN